VSYKEEEDAARLFLHGVCVWLGDQVSESRVLRRAPCRLYPDLPEESSQGNCGCSSREVGDEDGSLWIIDLVTSINSCLA
jgi:hypothetical protein